ncbi:DUF397 domain-containing protein [Spirillospora sp. NPDC127200]
MVDSSIQIPENAWRKSSHSNEGGDCVEVAALEGFLLVRDSYDRAGEVLVLDGARWRSLLAGIRSGGLTVGRDA